MLSLKGCKAAVCRYLYHICIMHLAHVHVGGYTFAYAHVYQEAFATYAVVVCSCERVRVTMHLYTYALWSFHDAARPGVCACVRHND